MIQNIGNPSIDKISFFVINFIIFMKNAFLIASCKINTYM